MQDIQVIKLIVAISFYPQLAIGDVSNRYCFEGEELRFNTKNELYVGLHHTSLYYDRPDLVNPIPGNFLSSDHILLGYISLFEYKDKISNCICNCYTISAIHALLLCVREIDTNEDMSRIVCDDWIELYRLTPKDGQDMVYRALQIRQLWRKCFNKIFNAQTAAASFSNRSEAAILKQYIVSYLNTRPKYAMYRLLDFDVEHLHTKKPLLVEDIAQWREANEAIRYLLSEVMVEPLPNPTKGGVRLGNLNFNCLQVNSIGKENDRDKRKSDFKGYYCKICDKQFHFFSKTDIRRHLAKHL